MRVAVIGANGQLGTDICNQFSPKHEISALNHEDIEISDLDSCRTVLGSIKPDLVINTAAYHNVPLCEENETLSFQINGIGALNLAKAAEHDNFSLAHISTDYVFDGAKRSPYVEEDLPNPLNVYANTKLSGEYFVRNYCEKHFVIRVSGIYGATVCRAKGGNFITTMKKVAAEKPEVRVVDDEVLTPTPTREVARNMLRLVETDNYGLYHMTCEGSCSWYEFATVIFQSLELKTPLFACSVQDFPSPVKRPFYSVLENAGLKRIGLNDMPPWREALQSFLKDCDL